MRKKFKYYTTVEFAEVIFPAISLIPQWYRKLKIFDNETNTPIVDNYTKMNLTLKSCMPFFDSLSTGYFVTTWQDLVVTQENGAAKISWVLPPDPVVIRHEDTFKGIPTPVGYEKTSFAWTFPISFKTPKDYSILLLHPMNRLDLPFLTSSGVIDSDQGMHGGQIPFFIKEGFEGVIPKGTPIAQIIPFKKEAWELSQDDNLKNLDRYHKFLTNSVVRGWYKKSIWKKTEYR